jgi:hypothetical protein
MCSSVMQPSQKKKSPVKHDTWNFVIQPHSNTKLLRITSNLSITWRSVIQSRTPKNKTILVQMVREIRWWYTQAQTQNSPDNAVTTSWMSSDNFKAAFVKNCFISVLSKVIFIYRTGWIRDKWIIVFEMWLIPIFAETPGVPRAFHSLLPPLKSNSEIVSQSRVAHSEQIHVLPFHVWSYHRHNASDMLTYSLNEPPNPQSTVWLEDPKFLNVPFSCISFLKTAICSAKCSNRWHETNYHLTFKILNCSDWFIILSQENIIHNLHSISNLM